MKIAFDALPLLGRKTGIGFCADGQIRAMTTFHVEHQFVLNYFAVKNLEQHKQEMNAYLSGHQNISVRHAFCSPYLYRLLSGFLPVSYQWFFGSDCQITHFFNYIVPPGVSGKSVVTIHDMVYQAFPETVRGRTRRMLDLGLVKSMRRADRIVTDSEFSKSEIMKYYPEFAAKIRVVPCGVNLEKFHPVTDQKQIRNILKKYHVRSPYFLYLGTIEPRKNLERLMQAYARFLSTHANSSDSSENLPQLVLAGAKGWKNESLFRTIQQLHLEKNVLFTEYIADPDLCAVLSGALAFVFPSIYEGFGMPPLEAMACGTPVLVSDAASLPEVTGTSAVIVPPEDIQAMANGLELLYTDSALRKRLRAEGLARATQFSWERSAKLLYQVYEELLDESKKSEKSGK
ncbi:MAG: glycosyltransferase family 4 protein [Oscillospiraceae bacterium]|nr:glycosyltransferase family 4 protein [Oscillospiraceae bacterium]